MTNTQVGQVDDGDRWKSRLRRACRILVERGPLEILRQMRRHGLRESARFVGRNLRYMLAIAISRRFDRRYGVDTGGEIPSDRLQVIGEHARQGAFFLSTPARSFLRTLESLPDDLGAFAFVDFGCGKGRALLLAAASRNFRRVVGVEHAPALVAVANRNIEAWRGARRCRDVRAICADAACFELPPEPCVLYFFAPFDPPVLDAVLAGVAASFRTRPRPICAIYVAASDEVLPDEAMLAAGFRRRMPLPALRPDPGAARRLQYALYEMA